MIPLPTQAGKSSLVQPTSFIWYSDSPLKMVNGMVEFMYGFRTISIYAVVLCGHACDVTVSPRLALVLALD